MRLHCLNTANLLSKEDIISTKAKFRTVQIVFCSIGICLGSPYRFWEDHP